jgi:2-oxoglutarate ferredoxin oxidoreductase subunit alpha
MTSTTPDQTKTEREIEFLEEAVIRFAGDSGDGMQLTGNQFTTTAALFGNDLATFPDFPAEIRAPAGTLPGVSAFQVRFASFDIHTPGDAPDVLVIMNPAALKVHLKDLKKGGILIVNTGAFDKSKLRQAGWETDPLESESLASDYRLIKVDLNKLTKETLESSGLDARAVMRCKNFAALGMLLWMFNRSLQPTMTAIEAQFRKKDPKVADANIAVLKAGYHYGETVELLDHTYQVQPAKMPPGTYRNIMGNQAIALGIIAAQKLSGVPVYYGTYPITPASDVLHTLSTYKSEGVITFQAEDEIAAICSAIGASYGGCLGTTASSGPGIALKGEAIGLAVMAELPLVIINIQRGGPSTGLPTKTEQADLFQAVWGRNGECPVPVLAAATPADCFAMTLEAYRIAVKYMTPVLLLTDGYLANGAEPWRLPKIEDLPKLEVEFRTDPQGFQPYMRDPATKARPWVKAGTPGLRHRIGGLEKEDVTGNVSYDPDNHFHMVKTRAAKVQAVADDIPEPEFEGAREGELLVVGWGSTHGAIRGGLRAAERVGAKASRLHLRHIWPLPKSLEETIGRFKTILVPEMNMGQLVRILAAEIPANYVSMPKVTGRPFSNREIGDKVKELLR